MCASKMEPRHCEPVRTLANPPDFQDTIIEQLPLFFCVYGRTGPVLADRKIRGIATPACALVRNDMFYFSAINTNLSYRTDTCSAPFRAAPVLTELPREPKRIGSGPCPPNTNLSYRTDTCPALFCVAAGGGPHCICTEI